MAKEKIKNGTAARSTLAGTITICPDCGNNANGPGHDNGICFFAKRENDIVASRKKNDPASINA